MKKNSFMPKNNIQLNRKQLLKLESMCKGFNNIYDILLDCPCEYDDLSRSDAILLLMKIDNVFVSFIDHFDSVS